MNRRYVWAFVVTLFAISDLQVCRASEFVPLGVSPGQVYFSAATAISRDGQIVAGEGLRLPAGAVFSNAFNWTDLSGRIDLQDVSQLESYSTTARGVANDGTISGTIHDDPNPPQAYRWKAGDGFVSLGFLSDVGLASSYGDGISSDGLAIVGSSSSNNSSSEAFYWTEELGMQGLGDLSGGEFWSQALGVSNDGSVVVGRATSELGSEAFYWTAATSMVGIGDIPGGEFLSYATGVSSDGTVLVGNGSSVNSGIAQEAFRWSNAGGIEPLGALTGASFYSYAEAVSRDGSVVVGTSDGSPDSVYDDAFVWDTIHGIRDLQHVLSSFSGLEDVLSGWTLTTATDISDDGLSIVGAGINPDGVREAWLVRLDRPISAPEPSSLVLLIFAGAGVAAFNRTCATRHP